MKGIKHKFKYLSIIFAIVLASAHPKACFSQTDDKEALSKAIEYFGGQKYHEALLQFKRLNTKYKLNSRFQAYLAVCYFKEQDYENAISIFDKIMPELTPFPPQEQAVYNFSNAESHFFLAQAQTEQEKQQAEYEKAIKFYESTILLCSNSDKGDVYFKLGFCNFFCNETDKALDCFEKAKFWYKNSSPNNEASISRRKQIEVMVKKLLISHRTSRMDMGNEETWDNKNKDTDNKGSNIESND